MTERVLTLVLVGSLAVGPVAYAQQPPPASPLSAYKGREARVASTLSGGATARGILLDLDATSVTVLFPEGREQKIPIESITHMELALGKKRHVWQGALVGAIAIGLGGGLTEDINPQTCSAENNPCSRGEAVAIDAAAGALIGALVGALIKTTRWSPVAVEALRPPHTPVAQSRGGLSLQFTVRF